MKINQKYFTLCRAVEYKHCGVIDMLFSEMWDMLISFPKHFRWFLKFMEQNDIRFTGGKHK